jgi:hypothetical protein
MDTVRPDNDDTEGQELDYVSIQHEQAYQPNQPPSPAESSPLSSTSSAPSRPVSPMSLPPPSPSTFTDSALTPDPLATDNAPSTQGRTKNQLKRLKKSKQNRALKRERDKAARVGSSNAIRTRSARNHIIGCDSILTPADLKRLRVTKPGWIAMRDVKGRIYEDARKKRWTLEELKKAGIDIVKWDGK